MKHRNPGDINHPGLLLLLVAALGTGSHLLGHTTPDMTGARLAVHVWANALLNRDLDTMASVLADDMRTEGGQTRDEYVQSLRQGMHKITRVWLRFAYFERQCQVIEETAMPTRSMPSPTPAQRVQVTAFQSANARSRSAR